MDTTFNSLITKARFDIIGVFYRIKTIFRQLNIGLYNEVDTLELNLKSIVSSKDLSTTHVQKAMQSIEKILDAIKLSTNNSTILIIHEELLHLQCALDKDLISVCQTLINFGIALNKDLYKNVVGNICNKCKSPGVFSEKVMGEYYNVCRICGHEE